MTSASLLGAAGARAACTSRWMGASLRAVAALTSACLLLAGCVGFSADGGFGAVESAVRERTGQSARWVRSSDESNSVRSRVKELLTGPLTAQTAVAIALLSNPGLQASYAEMGIAEADLVQASRWSGPKLSLARLRHGNETAYDRSVFLDVLGLVTIPLQTRLHEKRFEAAQARAVGEALHLALETRKAYFGAVAAEETVRYMGQVKAAAEAGAELARRMRAVGNWSTLHQQREQAFDAETSAMLARVKQTRVSARERLIRQMGLWGEDVDFRLAERLPDLPSTPREAGDLEAQGLAQRLDVQGARRETEALAVSMGLTRVSGFLNLLELGFIHNTDSPREVQRGWEFELRIPIFDFGEARVARAEQEYMRSVNRTADLAIRARSELRESYTAYRTAFDLARHYRDEIVPLRKRISEEMLLRYNGMLSSVFELLADARETAASVNAHIEALRDFWLAESDLQFALTGGSPDTSRGPARTPNLPAGGGSVKH